jgi:branched-chain amino acid transport system permease protein
LSSIREWLSSGALYALWALAFSLTAAPQQAFNVVPPTAGLVAGYVAVTVSGSTGRPLLSFLVAALSGSAFALICQVYLVSPLLKSRDASRAILLGTLGVLGVTQALIALFKSSELVSLRQFDGHREIFEYVFSDAGIWMIDGGLIVGILLIIWISLLSTRVGLIYRGICDNRDTARFYQLKVVQFDILSAGLAGLVASIAGILTAGGRAISPASGISFAIWGIAGAVIGGRNDIRSAFAGGLILGLIEVSALRYFPSAAKDILIGAVVILVLLVRPNGIFVFRNRRA